MGRQMATPEIELNEILQISPTTRMRYMGLGDARPEVLVNGVWKERCIAKLTPAQIAQWMARKAA